ncbi:hypothetical protein K2173_025798 [Erythroxylum novogranatense]|uniref:Uncharacterized protein n=1 Tax=Erythroxylum novogranatense TaxID=1862640 RepID=A0AAV8SHA5_9ROSI|nr:hypothetical protein K2173_025798 [Erythroxylum novogranatense]
MGVAILYPQDCLQNPLSNRQTLISPPRSTKQPRNANRAKSNGRRRSPNKSSPSRATTAQVPVKKFLMGEVKILKRGEQLEQPVPVQPQPQLPKRGDLQDKTSQSVKKTESLDLGSPKSSPSRGRPTGSNRVNGFYAGSAFITSPPPSSLPLPVFFMKNNDVKKNEDATTDLRRILGISLSL